MWLRLALSIGAALGAAVVAAVVVTVLDLYVTGHGYGSVMREVITLDQAGVHLSLGDVVMLVAAIAVAVSTWYLTGRRA